MVPMICMTLAALLIATAANTAAYANIATVPTSENILVTPSRCGPVLYDFQIPNNGCDESDADETFLGHDLPAVYKSDGATIITRCTAPGTIALTYDDGPFKYTDELLDILKAKGAKATFFINGDNNARLEDYDGVVKRAYREGHQIASHTWSHKDLSKMDARHVRKEMTDLDNAIKALIGVKPRYMRPPFGSLSTTARRTLGAMGYNVVMWDIDTNDWRHPNDIDKSLRPIRKAINSGYKEKGGHNILMHDIIEKTATMLTPRAIDLIKARRFKMVTVGECLGKPKSAWYRK